MDALYYDDDLKKLCVDLSLIYPPTDKNVIDRIVRLKEDAHNFILKDDLVRAEQSYTMVLRACVLLSSKQRVLKYKPTFLCQRSILRFKQFNNRGARTDLTHALTMCSTVIQEMYTERKVVNAFESLIGVKHTVKESFRFLDRELCAGNDGNFDGITSIVADICAVIPHIPTADETEAVLSNSGVLDMVSYKFRKSLIFKLSHNQKWESLAILISGYTKSGYAACAVNKLYKTNCVDISVGKLLSDSTNHTLRLWGEDLAVSLIRNGAQWNDIGTSQGVPILHYLVKMSLAIESAKLLQLVMSLYATDICNILAEKDKEGNTAFHILVMSRTFGTKTGGLVLDLFLRHGISLSLKNNKGKTVLDYLRLNRLQKADERSGSAKSTSSWDDTFTDGYSTISKRSDKEASLDTMRYCLCGRALEILTNVSESFEVYMNGIENVSKDDMIILLVKAVELLKNTPERTLTEMYKQLYAVDAALWPQVLEILNQKADWWTIGILLLGPDMERKHNYGSFVSDSDTVRLCTGVVSTSSLDILNAASVYAYLERRNSLESMSLFWLEITIFAIFRNREESFAQCLCVDESDNILHASVRFALLTNTTSIMREVVRYTEDLRSLERNGKGDTVFHTVSKVRNISDYKIMQTVTDILVEQGFSALTKDVNGNRPVEFLDRNCPGNIFDIFFDPDQNVHFAEISRSNASGDAMFKDHCLEKAIQDYTRAITVLQEHLPQIPRSKKSSLDIEGMFMKLTDCLLDKNLTQEAVENLKQCIAMNEHYFKANLRVGVLLRGTDDPQEALKYLLKAYHCVKDGGEDSNSAKEHVFTEMIPVLQSLSNRSKSLVISKSEAPIWARVCYKLVTNDDWEAANVAYEQFQHNEWKKDQTLALNLKPFCGIDKLQKHPWCLGLIHYLLECGSDEKTLSFERENTYLQAVVRVTLVGGSERLLTFLLSRPELTYHLHVDTKGNTLLHTAARQANVKPKIRYKVLNELVKCRVDASVQNMDGKVAIEYLPTSEADNIKILLQAMHSKGVHMLMTKAANLGQYKLLLALLKCGADPMSLSGEDGDTPMHAVVRLALKDGNISVLEYCLERYGNESKPSLDPERLDPNGDCLFHLLAKSTSIHVVKVVKCLCKFKVSGNYYNREGKLPADCIVNRKDGLLQNLKKAKSFKARHKQLCNKVKTDAVFLVKQDSNLEKVEKDLSRSVVEHAIKKVTEKDKIKIRIRKMIEQLASTETLPDETIETHLQTTNTPIQTEYTHSSSATHIDINNTIEIGRYWKH
ncbi:uncharacterized protein LOC127835580 [Dreissena polymorpha]|uniref:Uncharacterized protein n=1 Tax=Dreissena polymorpha TaxID=45954 RepID=A0A9D4G1M6_DREPO|nr:uncharacterized protein LOC127835580 [Dreissena polymorpha]KAH3807146.1 hypothetical protein DPMN_135479 [Dreissena polymorpha]